MLRRVFGHPFIRKVALLSGGIGAAYTLQFLAYPIISRRYTPEDMGLYGVFLSVVSVMALFAPLRLEVAILGADNRRESWLLTISSWLSTLVVTPFAALGVWGMGQVGFLGLESLSTAALGLAVPAVAFGAWFESCRYSTLAQDSFRRLSAAMVVQSAARVTVQIGLGYSGFGGIGLLIGEVAAKVCAAAWLLPPLLRGLRVDGVRWSLADLWGNTIKYRRFPLLMLPSSLLDVLALSLTVPLVAARFGVDAAGSLSFVQRLVAAPLAVVSASVADTFHAEASNLRMNEPTRLGPMFRAVSIRLFLLGLLPASVLALVGPELFQFVFGDKWVVAGHLSVYLAPLL
ncbi:MAG: oligosaccharide flippase family protein, partial [Candidatus Eremiobacterota bacterium]